MSVQCISRFLLKVEYKPRNMSHNIEIVLSYFLYTSQRARIISLSPLYSSSAFWVICSVIQCYPGGCQSGKKKKKQNFSPAIVANNFQKLLFFYLHTTIRPQHDSFQSKFVFAFLSHFTPVLLPPLYLPAFLCHVSPCNTSVSPFVVL